MFENNYISKLKDNELIRGSFFLIALTFIGNIFSYLFQFFMARMLGPSDYVIIAIITSILGIFAIPTMAIQTVISKNTTELKIKKQDGKIQGLMNFALRKMLMLSFIMFTIYCLLSLFLTRELGIDYVYLFIGGLFIFSSFTYPVLTGIIQGLKKFKDLGINFFINCFVKFIAGVILVSVGLGVYGAIIGFLLGITAAFFILFFDITSIINAKYEKFEVKLFSRDNAYPLLAMLFIVLMYSLDVIFAKAFFSSDIAGRYSVISLIGKTILFVVSSIGTAMFPISTERYAVGENTMSVFRKAFLVSLTICIVAITIFSIFPQIIINILFGEQYASISPLLVYLGIAFSFCSLLYLIILNRISTNNLKFFGIICLTLCLLIEISAFFLFNSTIEQFTIGFMIANIISFFIGLGVLIKK